MRVKKWVFPVLFAGVILGTVCVNAVGSKAVADSGVFGNLYLQRIAAVCPRMDDLFWYVAGTRLKELAILLLLMMTPFRKIFLKGLVFGCGFVNGLLAGAGVIQQGVRGFWLFLLLSLPACLFFYPGMFRLCESMCRTNSKNVVLGIVMGVLVVLLCASLESCSFLFVIKKFY